MASGTVICLGALGYQLQTQPAPVGAVLPTAVTLTTPTPRPSVVTTSPSPSPSLKPLPYTKRRVGKAAASKLIKSFHPARDGLLTNEYAFWNPGDARAVVSGDWDMTSGSLFGRGGAFWTGRPDDCEPDSRSAVCTDSDVFRLNTKQKFSGNLRVSLALMQLENIRNSNCNDNDTCWHGTHVWLRYQNEFNLYYASINRADGHAVIKRKVPCGTDNDGTYFVLGSYVPHTFRTNAWSYYQVTIQTNLDRSVTIKLYDTAVSTTKPVTTGTDRGGTNPKWSSSCSTPGRYNSAKYTPITQAGAVGIRGDYANFVFRDFSVSKL